MSMKDFRGTIPALITPFDRDGNVDAPKFRHFLDWLVPQVSGSTSAVRMVPDPS